MRFLRGTAGAVLWTVASVVGSLAVIVWVTVVLLRIGSPLLMPAKQIVRPVIGLLLPRGATHPVDEGSKKMSKTKDDAATKAGKVSRAGRKRAGRLDKATDKKAGKLADRGGKRVNKADKVGKKGDGKVSDLAKKGGKKARELTGRKKSRLPWRR